MGGFGALNSPLEHILELRLLMESNMKQQDSVLLLGNFNISSGIPMCLETQMLRVLRCF